MEFLQKLKCQIYSPIIKNFELSMDFRNKEKMQEKFEYDTEEKMAYQVN